MHARRWKSEGLKRARTCLSRSLAGTATIRGLRYVLLEILGSAVATALEKLFAAGE